MLISANCDLRKLDELTQQVQSLQAIVNANNAQAITPNNGSPTGPIAAGHQVLDGSRVPSLQAFPSIENIPTQVPHSLHMPGALPETNQHSGMPYQSTNLAESPYQSSISYPTGARGQSIHESTIEALRDGSASDTYINNSRAAGPLTPASELRLGASRSTIPPYNSFQQAYVAAQPRSIGSVSLVSNQICQLFQT
jgi:hypothetical protein